LQAKLARINPSGKLHMIYIDMPIFKNEKGMLHRNGNSTRIGIWNFGNN
jgi:hypothetical protein